MFLARNLKTSVMSRGIKQILLVMGFFFVNSALAHPIQDFYKKHKNDKEMEAQIVPPKIAAMWIDEDYQEAIDILKSMSTLKYLNFQGEKSAISQYAKKAIASQGGHELLLTDQDKRGKIKIFGERKKGFVRKLFAVVETANEFVLVIGKGKLTSDQVAALPALAREI